MKEIKSIHSLLHPPTHPSVHASMHPSMHPLTYLSIHQYIHPSTHPYLSIYLSLYHLSLPLSPSLLPPSLMDAPGVTQEPVHGELEDGTCLSCHAEFRNPVNSNLSHCWTDTHYRTVEYTGPEGSSWAPKTTGTHSNKIKQQP